MPRVKQANPTKNKGEKRKLVKFYVKPKSKAPANPAGNTKLAIQQSAYLAPGNQVKPGAGTEVAIPRVKPSGNKPSVNINNYHKLRNVQPPTTQPPPSGPAQSV